MNAAIIQLLVLAGVALFLILRLRSVLGTREGFEKPKIPAARPGPAATRPGFEIIEGGVDSDITDHVKDGTPAAKALASMKMTEPGFSVHEFLSGARGAYEMILMGYENGDLDTIRPFLSDEVYQTFASSIAAREQQGLHIEASFIGIRELSLHDARFARDTNEAELTVRFIGELSSCVRNAQNEIVEGNPNEIKRQRDIWTFARIMGSSDPNWRLVATGE